MTFKIKLNDYFGSDWTLSVVDDSFVDRLKTIQHHGMPKIQNKVILRGGLRYDEAWLCLHLPPNQQVGTPPMSSGQWINRLNGSFAITIIIDGWETDNWRCLNTWKIACGDKTLWLCHFVDTRYFLCETPDMASLTLRHSGMGLVPGYGAVPYYGNTVEFQRVFGTGSLEKALVTLLEANYTPTGVSAKIGDKGTWKAPWSDSTWSALAGHFSDINLLDKTTLHFAQYLLDHYEGLLVRDYAGASTTGSQKNLTKWDIVGWDSGSTPPGPYLCSWDCPKPTNVQFPNNFGPQLPIARNAIFDRGHAGVQVGVLFTSPPSNNPSLPFTTGLSRIAYEYCDIDYGTSSTGVFRGAFSSTPLFRSLAFHRNRNKEGYVLPGYVAYAPSGKFDTVIFEKATTTLLRAPIERPTYHRQPMGEVYTALVEGCGIWPGDVGPVLVTHGSGIFFGNLVERALCYNVSSDFIPAGYTTVFKFAQNLQPVGSSGSPGANALPTDHILRNQFPRYFTGLRHHTILPDGDTGIAGVLYHDLFGDGEIKVSTGPVEGPGDCSVSPYI